MWKAFWAGSVSLAMLAAAVARADGQPGLQLKVGPVEIQAGAEVEPAAAELGEYWLGVLAVPLPSPLRAQLDLREGQGLLVTAVFPDSPAKKAGLREFDVLLKVGDRALSRLPDLIQAVNNSKEQKLTLEVVRGGKQIKVDVAPAKRPEHVRPPEGVPGREESDWGTLRRWLEQMPGELGREPMRFHVFGPGAILPPARPLPGDMTVTVTRHGSEPAKIVVKQGDKQWEITDKELDKLPADVRHHVEPLLRGGYTVRMFEGVPRGLQQQFGTPPAPELRGRMERRLEEMNRRVEELRRELNDLRGRPEKAQPEKPRPEKPNPGSLSPPNKI
jgi:hypothetical protein